MRVFVLPPRAEEGRACEGKEASAYVLEVGREVNEVFRTRNSRRHRERRVKRIKRTCRTRGMNV